MQNTDLVGDYVVLYSDIQDAYHVELRSQYAVKGKTDGNWVIVDSVGSYVDGLNRAHERRMAKMDKARK